MINRTDRTPSRTGTAGEYSYRRPLRAAEMLPAIGAGVGVAVVTGLAVFYITKLFLEKTPLLNEPRRSGSIPGTPRAT